MNNLISMIFHKETTIHLYIKTRICIRHILKRIFIQNIEQ